MSVYRDSLHVHTLIVLRRRTDMLNFVLNTSKLNVTDLDTLQRILSLTKASPVALTIVPGTLSRSLVYIRNLAITIRLPLRTFRLISRYVKGINTSLINYKHAAWLRVIKALTKLTQLQTLSLWVDHDSGSPWSRVNERTFFSPLQELMQKRPKLKISVDVPTIDPRRIDDERHYTTNGPRPPFILNRTRRHGYWVGMSTEGFCHTGQDKHTEDSVSDCPTCDERTIDSPDERASADDTLAHVDDSKRSIDKVKLEEIESRIEKLCLREIKANAVIQEGRRTLRVRSIS